MPVNRSVPDVAQKRKDWNGLISGFKASDLTGTTMTVSPTKREPPFGAGTPGGGFLFLRMVNLTFGIPDLSIPDSPQKSSAVQKVYRAGFAAEGRPVLVQPLSLTSFDSSPSRGASGETVHFTGTAKASPTRRGGNASALTERLFIYCTRCVCAPPSSRSSCTR